MTARPNSRRYKVRRARSLSEIPDLEPKRYLTSSGYFVLRWRLDTCSYLECLEHRYVMGIPRGRHVHHINKIKTDNRPENLRVVTSSEHRREHRTVDRVSLRRLASGKITQAEIAAELACHPAAVSRVVKELGIGWVPHSTAIPLPITPVLESYKQGMSPRKIAADLGCSDTPIRRILKEAGMTSRQVGRPGTLGPDAPKGEEAPHGSTARYRAGCKCPQCRAANAAYEANRKAAKLRGSGV